LWATDITRCPWKNIEEGKAHHTRAIGGTSGMAFYCLPFLIHPQRIYSTYTFYRCSEPSDVHPPDYGRGGWGSAGWICRPLGCLHRAMLGSMLDREHGGLQQISVFVLTSAYEGHYWILESARLWDGDDEMRWNPKLLSADGGTVCWSHSCCGCRRPTRDTCTSRMIIQLMPVCEQLNPMVHRTIVNAIYSDMLRRWNNLNLISKQFIYKLVEIKRKSIWSSNQHQILPLK